MRVLAVGDSITRGLNTTVGGVECQSYARWLADATNGHATVLAEAGASASTILEKFGDALHGGGEHDLAVVFVGVNDALAANWDPDSFEMAHLEILRRASGVAAQTITLAIPPWMGQMLVPRKRVTEANTLIGQNAATLGLAAVDLPDWRGRSTVWADRIHPTSLGQLVIADHVAEAVGCRRPSGMVLAPRLGLKYDLWYGYRAARYLLWQSLSKIKRAVQGRSR